MPNFGDLLKADREALGWSQEQLGKELGVSQQTVGQWEANGAQPRRHRMQTLMKLLNVHLHGRSQLYAQWAGALPVVPHVTFTDPKGPPPRFGQPDSRAEVQKLLRDALPEHLRQYVARALQFGHQEKQYDYLSPSLTARVLPTVDGRPPTLGMAVVTLHLAMAAMRNIHHFGPKPTTALFVLTPDMPAVALKRMGTAAADAQVLGVEVIPVPDVGTMGRTIAQLEVQYIEDTRQFNDEMDKMLADTVENWEAIDTPLEDLPPDPEQKQ